MAEHLVSILGVSYDLPSHHLYRNSDTQTGDLERTTSTRLSVSNTQISYLAELLDGIIEVHHGVARLEVAAANVAGSEPPLPA